MTPARLELNNFPMGFDAVVEDISNHEWVEESLKEISNKNNRQIEIFYSFSHTNWGFFTPKKKQIVCNL